MVATLGLAVAASWMAAASAAPAAPAQRSPVGRPTVTGPVTGGKGSPGILAVATNPASVGYTVDEYFFGGDATLYSPKGALGVNGKWKLARAGEAPYKSRMVVWKPSDPSDFNGTVFVEWLNVSAGFDVPYDWLLTHHRIIEEGAAWVGVSAQSTGIEGGQSVFQVQGVAGVPTGGLKKDDPARYGTLSHPGDGYSFDIYSQAAVAIRGDGTGVNPFDGDKVKRVIGTGESQSAMRMTSYVNGVAPIAGVYDGYLLHSRADRSPTFANPSQSRDPSVPSGVQIRNDIDVPVMLVQTESDATSLGYVPQPDRRNIRLWEIAGASHIDAYNGIADPNDGSMEAALLDPTKLSRSSSNCDANVNGGVQQPVVEAAFVNLERWVKTGRAPSRAPSIQRNGSALARDENGIALGGVRTPLVDVPIAVNTGEPNSGAADICRLRGTSAALSPAALAKRYPNGSSTYVSEFAKSADKAVEDGFWLPDAAAHWKAASQKVTFG